MSNYLNLIPGNLLLSDIRQIIYSNTGLNLNPDVKNDMQKSVDTIAKLQESGGQFYGINTGFGKFVNQRIQSSDVRQLQVNLLRSHAMGVGPCLNDSVVKTILLLKINALAQGYSGIRYSLIENLMAYINYHLLPCVPSYGSVGASGDLAPLAHLSLTLLGEGYFHHQNQHIPAKDGLRLLNLTSYELIEKEGLALINGTEVSTALCLGAYFMLEHCFAAVLLASSLAFIVCKTNVEVLDERLHHLKKQNGQILCASALKTLIEGSEIKSDPNKIQDRYSLRCVPQVLGPCLDHMYHVANILYRESNAVTDNPLIFSSSNTILSGGNFHAESVAFCADILAIVICELGSIIERQIAYMLDTPIALLPPFLSGNPGLESGLMMAHVTVASLVSENKAQAYPRCIDNISTSGGQEDHVSMATQASLRLYSMIDRLSYMIGFEFQVLLTAMDYHRPQKASKTLEAVLSHMEKYIKPYKKDRVIDNEIEKLAQSIKNGDYINYLSSLLKFSGF